MVKMKKKKYIKMGMKLIFFYEKLNIFVLISKEDKLN